MAYEKVVCSGDGDELFRLRRGGDDVAKVVDESVLVAVAAEK